MREEPQTRKVESVICVPGYWADYDELKIAIVEATKGEYLVAGGIMMHVMQKYHFRLEVYERDERLTESFEIAGRVTRVRPEFLDQIDKHEVVVYLIGESGGLKDAERIAHAGAAILKAGGIGIKVETAGKAFEKEKWFTYLNDFQESNLYEMFVVDSIMEKDGTVFSCGMQNLGLKDTIISDHPFQDAVDLISTFGYYQIIDKPDEIRSNHTFSVAIDAPVYRITEELNYPYKDEDVLGNPYGMQLPLEIDYTVICAN